jgi:hypothetical protein
LPPGDYSFALKDLSDENVDFSLARLLDGKTFQDMLDLQIEPGEFITSPSWTVNPIALGFTWHESIGGKVYTFSLNKEGEYVTGVWSPSSISYWLCAPLWVIEDPSE